MNDYNNDRLTILMALFQTMDLVLNISQTSNDTLLNELNHQNEEYLDKIVNQNEEIINLLKKVDN